MEGRLGVEQIRRKEGSGLDWIRMQGKGRRWGGSGPVESGWGCACSENFRRQQNGGALVLWVAGRGRRRNLQKEEHG
jgi:hypothetical protein